MGSFSNTNIDDGREKKLPLPCLWLLSRTSPKPNNLTLHHQAQHQHRLKIQQQLPNQHLLKIQQQRPNQHLRKIQQQRQNPHLLKIQQQQPNQHLLKIQQQRQNQHLLKIQQRRHQLCDQRQPHLHLMRRQPLERQLSAWLALSLQRFSHTKSSHESTFVRCCLASHSGNELFYSGSVLETSILDFTGQNFFGDSLNLLILFFNFSH